MRYPQLNRSRGYSVAVPELSGGLNVNDAPVTVEDNQLTNASNVWWRNNALTTRPGLYRTSSGAYPYYSSPDENGKHKFEFYNDTGVEFWHEGVKYHIKVGMYEDQGRYMTDIFMFGSDSNSKKVLRTVRYNDPNNYCDWLPQPQRDAWGSYTASRHDLRIPKQEGYVPRCACYQATSTVQHSNYYGVGIYFVVGSVDAATQSIAGDSFAVYELCKITSALSQGTINDITADTVTGNYGFLLVDVAAHIYTPTVLLCGKGDRYYTLPSDVTAKAAPAVTYEAYNVLPGMYTAKYLSDGASSSFTLPMQPRDGATVVFKWVGTQGSLDITYNTATGNTFFRIFTASGAAEQGSIVISGEATYTEFLLSVEDKTITLRANGKSTSNADLNNVPVALPLYEGSNNITITVDYTDSGMLAQVLNMQKSVQFGGSQGLNGGTFAFLGANSAEPALVRYSDADKPLYFPMNNYIYIGNTNQEVTAFGKQDEYLIVFKEHELYRMSYVEGTEITEDQLTGGYVNDVTVMAATFPVYQVHGSIGCDCPGTVQLCQNRLCFASSDGRVYTLVTASNTSETNVYDISMNVRADVMRRGYTAEEWKAAASADYSGHYFVFIRNDAYLMDYENNSYTYVYSYNYGNQKKHRWYYWDFGEREDNIEAVVSDGVRISILTRCTPNDKAEIYHFYTLKGHEDDCPTEEAAQDDSAFIKKAITATFTTKFFDFSHPEMYKRVSHVYLEAGVVDDDDTAAKLGVSWKTERGMSYEIPIEVLPARDGHAQEQEMRLLPNLHGIRRFGIQVSCTGVLCIYGFTIKYQILGSVR